MEHLKRTHRCGDLRPSQAGEKVGVMGWVHRSRDHGGLIFVDVRDRSGIVQALFSPDVDGNTFNMAKELRSEYVVALEGRLDLRPEGRINAALETGEVEIYVDRCEILNPARTPPFPINENTEVEEALRLQYRYLDLRRQLLQNNIAFRHRVVKAVRDFYDSRGFYEIETPVLTRSTPEGARDYLVPSRVNPGRFYALPQSPQLFKQLLMVGGMERYFQVVRCFRDEDLRADRQPEFTQVDVEMAFVDMEDVIQGTEEMLQYVIHTTLGIDVPLPFPRITYDESMLRYGTDRPDRRYGMEISDLAGVFQGTGFKVFQEALASGVVRGFRVKGGGRFSRRELDETVARAQDLGASGLLWFVFEEEQVRSPTVKFLSEGELRRLRAVLDAVPGDLGLVVAGPEGVVAPVLGSLRVEMAARLDLRREGLGFTWVTDFPLLEFSEEEGKYVSVHHPFTAPRDADLLALEGSPGLVRAKSYDVVLNGVELGGGSIRIHKRGVQEQVFRVLGMGDEEAREKFGYLLDAFEYGTPPHGGIALGLDRMVMLLNGNDSIRDVIAFPKTAKASCLMTGAPSPVGERQLRELHLRLT
jgi:aspartyl-tRNA synthetase